MGKDLKKGKIIRLQESLLSAAAQNQSSNALEPVIPAEALFHLEQSCFQNGWNLKQIQDELEHKDAWIFAYKVNKIILGAIFWRLIGNELWLMRILVHPDYRRQKIASQLLESYQETQVTFDSIWLEVSQNNTAAIEFYKKNGFELCGERKNYYPTQDATKSPHAFVFQKNLQNSL